MIAVGAGSFAFRALPLLLLERRTLGAGADRVIRHAGTAVLTAVVTLSATHSAQSGNPLPTLCSMVVALGLASRRSSTLRILSAGGIVFAVTTWMVGAVAG